MKSIKTIRTLTVLVLVMLTVVMGILVATANEAEPTETLAVDMTGQWRVAVYAKEAQPADKMLTFDDTKVTYYPGDGADEITSEYKIENGVLEIPDLKKFFQIEVVTDNILTLIEVDGPHWLIARTASSVETVVLGAPYNYDGEWQVILHGGSAVDELLKLEGSSITFFKAGSEAPYFEGTFVWEDTNVMYVEAIGMHMTYYPLSDSSVVMIEEGENYPWEIKRIAE